MPKEFINVIDDNLSLLKREESKIVHEKGLLHVAVRALLINSSQQILLVQKKKNVYFPKSFFDLTVSEDVFSGESPDKAVIRYLFMNLGLEFGSISLFSLGTVKEHKIFKRSKYIDNTISQIFLIKNDIDFDTIKLNSDRVDGFLWLDYIDFVKKFFTINYGGLNLVSRNKVYYEIFQVLGIPPLK